MGTSDNPEAPVTPVDHEQLFKKLLEQRLGSASDDPLSQGMHFLNQFMANDPTSMGTYMISCFLAAIALELSRRP